MERIEHCNKLAGLIAGFLNEVPGWSAAFVASANVPGCLNVMAVGPGGHRVSAIAFRRSDPERETQIERYELTAPSGFSAEIFCLDGQWWLRRGTTQELFDSDCLYRLVTGFARYQSLACMYG